MKTLISLGVAVTLATPLMLNTTPVHAIEVTGEQELVEIEDGGGGADYGGGGGCGGGGGDYGGGDYGGGDYGGGDFAVAGAGDMADGFFVPPLAAYLAAQAAAAAGRVAFLRLAMMVAALEAEAAAAGNAVADPTATDEEVEQAFD